MSLMWAVLAFCLVIGIFTLLTWFATRAVGKAAGASAAQRFRDAEYIVENERLPESWKAKLGGLDKGEREHVLAAKHEELLRFFRTAPVFADEHARRELLDRLSRVLGKVT